MSTEITHSEYIGDVVSSSSASTFAHAIIGGSNATYPQLQINAGNAIIFPWLSRIAPQWIHYEFHDLVIEFQSTSATALNSTNTQLGLLHCRHEHNPTQPLDGSMAQVLNTHGHYKAPPYRSWHYRIPPMNNPKLIRTTIGNTTTNWGLGGTQDIRHYDHGWFNVSTSALQGTSVNCGQMHVHYRVRLHRPYLNTTIPSGMINSFYRYYSSGTAPTNTAPFQGTWVLRTSGEFTNVNPTFTNSIITFPNSITGGEYVLDLFAFGTAAATSFTAVPVVTNCTVDSDFTGGPDTNVQKAGDTSTQTARNIMCSIKITITAGGATLDYNAVYATYPTTITDSAIMCYPSYAI